MVQLCVMLPEFPSGSKDDDKNVYIVFVVPSVGRGKMATGRWFNTSTCSVATDTLPASSVANTVIFFQPGVAQAAKGLALSL